MAPAATRPAGQQKKWASGTDGFPGRATASSAACFDAVFLQIGPVCVTWTGIEIHFSVVVRALVEVLNKHSYRCAKGGVELCTRLDLHSILLISLQLARLQKNMLEWLAQIVLAFVWKVGLGYRPRSTASLIVRKSEASLIPGGQFSTIQPTLLQCDSPYVVTLNSVPNDDIVFAQI